MASCHTHAAFLSAILTPSCFSISVVGGCVGMAGCHTLLNKKRQNSNKFWRLTVCRKRA